MTPKYIDIHSHVQFNAFDADQDEVVKRALDSDTWMINVGTQIDTSRASVELANKYEEGVYSIVGLHPIHTGASYHDKQELGEGGKDFTSRGEVFDKDVYRELLKNPKVLGIGECGLDYYRMDVESMEKQKLALVAQIELANEVGKPIMLHIRNNKNDTSRALIDDARHGFAKPNAYFDALDILKKYAKVKGDVHFFAGGPPEAQAFLDFGFTLSFTGVITFTHDYDEVIKNTPLDMIMSETDCPYLTPVPHRGKRNEPHHVRGVVKRIAEIKGLPEQDVAQAIVSNARRVFGF
ncbi:MAG: TatD family hydrolase [Patescibacteria group bacterium]